MKKHQLAAMVLSALSAGLIISCSRPSNDETAAVNADKNPKTEGGNASSTVGENTSSNITSNATSNAINVATPASAQSRVSLPDAALHTYLAHVSEAQIVPAYRQAMTQSQKLRDLAKKHCSAGAVKGEALQALRSQWLALAQAWAAAEIVNFGAVNDHMTHLYINYYPDERGLVHKGVPELIAAHPSLTPAQMAQESAIVQGIPGLEEVLYGNDALDKAQCQYVQSVSAALTDRLTALHRAWAVTPSPLLVSLDATEQDTKAEVNRQVEDAVKGATKGTASAFHDHASAGMTQWLNSVLALVETSKSVALDKPLGLTGHKKGHLPAPAAKQSRAIFTAKVDALTQALTSEALQTVLAQSSHPAAKTVSAEVQAQLIAIQSTLQSMPADIADATPQAQQQLYEELTTLTQTIKRSLLPALGVQVGFNSTDGD